MTKPHVPLSGRTVTARVSVETGPVEPGPGASSPLAHGEGRFGPGPVSGRPGLRLRP